MLKIVKFTGGCFMGKSITGSNELLDPVMVDYFPMQVPGRVHGQVNMVMARQFTPWPCDGVLIKQGEGTLCESIFSDDDDTEIVVAYKKFIAEHKAANKKILSS